MKLVRVPEPPGKAFIAHCCVCKQSIPLGTKIADLDGPAFEAYYHQKCLPLGSVVPPEAKEPKL